MGKLNVDGTEIQVLQIEEDDYISLTDMVRKIDNGPALIEKWLRNKNTIEFLGIWEEMYNADFNAAAYEEIMLEAGLLCRLSNGYPAQIQRVLWQRLDGMEGHTHIKILHLSLQAGYLRNSNYILSKNLNG